ncbi:hypothetical protein SCLCIDRAFT_583683 [Scleroderma citrinum Foug A]|uniref:Uncharacterized protein n=1 Tax=Scleroderma citrinum Foug A TaxID=1036808 RepID=A0A0C3AJC0_9AGAM|nr:hypothetical protein SCLCIDRAFT_583683 [Scleroderma citrinum Foug A]
MLTSVVWGPFLHDVRGRIATLVVDVPLMTGHLRSASTLPACCCEQLDAVGCSFFFQTSHHYLLIGCRRKFGDMTEKNTQLLRYSSFIHTALNWCILCLDCECSSNNEVLIVVSMPRCPSSQCFVVLRILLLHSSTLGAIPSWLCGACNSPTTMRTPRCCDTGCNY